MSLKFKKNKEDFICENCGENVFGDGYTNHCPKCLFSKHVDINPGDREESCQGLMEPKEIMKNGDEFSIIHQCKKCGLRKKNRFSDKDNFDKLIEISEKPK